MATNWRQNFNNRYRELKEKEGLSQVKLGEMLGLDQTTVGAWLRGTRSPDSLELMEKLAGALGLSLQELMFRDINTIDYELLTDCAKCVKISCAAKNIDVEFERKVMLTMKLYESSKDNGGVNESAIAQLFRDVF